MTDSKIKNTHLLPPCYPMASPVLSLAKSLPSGLSSTIMVWLSSSAGFPTAELPRRVPALTGDPFWHSLQA